MVSGGGAGPPQAGGERPRNGRETGEKGAGELWGRLPEPSFRPFSASPAWGSAQAAHLPRLPSEELRGPRAGSGHRLWGGGRGCLALEPTPGQFRLVGVAVLELRVAPRLVRRYSVFLLLGSSIHIKLYFRFFYFPFITN